MKNLLLIPVFAAIALLAQPALAEEHIHPSGPSAQAAQENAGPAGDMDAHEKLMQESVKKMQAQMAAIHQTKDSKKRQKLLQEHSRSMLDSMKMMHDMMGSMTMPCPMMSGHMMGGAAQAGDNAAAAPAAQAPGKTASADPTPAGDGKKVWTCPMHPDVVSDKPGLCPKCGMELVEVDPSGAAPSGQMGGCMMGGNCMMGGGMKGGCMMGGGMKGGCMKGGCMKGGCMMGGGMKGGCMMGGGMMGGGMMGMHDRHMGLMLMLMEQMIEHNDAATGIRK